MQQADSPDLKRDQMAADLINRYTAWAAAAGVIPIPVVDAAAVGAVQLKMLRELSSIYDVEFSANRGKSIIGALVGAVAPAGVAAGAASALKAVPVVGTALGSIAMPAASAAATYALGRVFTLHFASGGTLLDFNPKDYRDFMREQAAKKRSEAETSSTASSPAHADAKPA